MARQAIDTCLVIPLFCSLSFCNLNLLTLLLQALCTDIFSLEFFLYKGSW